MQSDKLLASTDALEATFRSLIRRAESEDDLDSIRLCLLRLLDQVSQQMNISLGDAISLSGMDRLMADILRVPFSVQKRASKVVEIPTIEVDW